MDTIVFAAVPAETRYLPEDVEVVHIGVGKTAAAIATTRRLAQIEPIRRHETRVVNVGSCGALVDGLVGVYEPGVVLNHDLSADALRALGHDPHERLVLPHGDPACVLATGDLFVADSSARAALARRATLVDMEGYAVALACEAFGIPVRLVKHVSDNADEGAVEWATLVETSARDLGAWWNREISG